MSEVKIAVLVSGGGTNLQTLIDTQKGGGFGTGKIVLVVSSSPTAYALTRAKENGIATAVVSKKDYPDPDECDNALLKALKDYDTDLVVLAGSLHIIGQKVLDFYQNRIINVHPSLIPSFCGHGFYGLKVHEAALRRGVKVTGATVHLVSDVVDGGEILMQQAVRVHDGDTVETLQKRVMQEAEWIILPKATAMMVEKIRNERKS